MKSPAAVLFEPEVAARGRRPRRRPAARGRGAGRDGGGGRVPFRPARDARRAGRAAAGGAGARGGGRRRGGRAGRDVARARRPRRAALAAELRRAASTAPAGGRRCAWRGRRSATPACSPDGTSRFSLDGRPIKYYAGVSTFSRYSVIPEAALLKMPGDLPLPRRGAARLRGGDGLRRGDERGEGEAGRHGRRLRRRGRGGAERRAGGGAGGGGDGRSRSTCTRRSCARRRASARRTRWTRRNADPVAARSANSPTAAASTSRSTSSATPAVTRQAYDALARLGTLVVDRHRPGGARGVAADDVADVRGAHGSSARSTAPAARGRTS